MQCTLSALEVPFPLIEIGGSGMDGFYPYIRNATDHRMVEQSDYALYIIFISSEIVDEAGQFHVVTAEIKEAAARNWVFRYPNPAYNARKGWARQMDGLVAEFMAALQP